MTTSFYAPPACFRGDAYVVLPEDEAAHAVRVLRHAPGDEIVVVDGEGGWHRVRLDQADRRTAAGTVLETRREVGEPGYTLRIGMALLKHRARFETFVEKAVELGASAILPLHTERTEKERIKQHRMEHMLVAAMKQCGRSRLTRLAAPQPLASVLADQEDDALRLIAHEQVGREARMAQVLATRPAQSFCILIGPEGGFTDAEIAAAQRAGYTAVSLGSRRLRAETAALAAATAVMLARD